MSKSRLSTIAAKATVREYAQGIAQSSVAPVANFLAPTVETIGPVGYFKRYDDKNRFVIPDTSRAIHGRAAQLGFEKTDATFNCTPNALDIPVDIAEGAADESMEASLREAAELGAEVGSLSHEKKVIDLALAQLTAGIANINFAADQDVVDQLDAYLIAVSKATGYGSLMGLGLLFGPTYARRFKNHPSVRARVTGGGKKDPASITFEDAIGLFLLKPEVRLSAMVFDTAKPGKAPVREFVLDDKLMVFARRDNPTRRDPSFMKTFRQRGAWMAPRTYLRDDERVEVAAMDWSEDVQVTNSSAGQLLGISN